MATDVHPRPPPRHPLYLCAAAVFQASRAAKRNDHKPSGKAASMYDCATPHFLGKIPCFCRTQLPRWACTAASQWKPRLTHNGAVGRSWHGSQAVLIVHMNSRNETHFPLSSSPLLTLLLSSPVSKHLACAEIRVRFCSTNSRPFAGVVTLFGPTDRPQLTHRSRCGGEGKL